MRVLCAFLFFLVSAHVCQGTESNDWAAANQELTGAVRPAVVLARLTEKTEAALGAESTIAETSQSGFPIIQLIFLTLLAWLFSYFTLYLLGMLLSELTLRGIATDQLDAKRWRTRALRRFYRLVIELAGIYYYVSLPMLPSRCAAGPVAYSRC